MVEKKEGLPAERERAEEVPEVEEVPALPPEVPRPEAPPDIGVEITRRWAEILAERGESVPPSRGIPERPVAPTPSVKPQGERGLLRSVSRFSLPRGEGEQETAASLEEELLGSREG